MRALSLSPRLVAWLPLALTPLYLLLVWSLAPVLGPAVGIPSLIWAPAGAYVFGLRGGLILAAGAIAAHELTFHVRVEKMPDYTLVRDLIGNTVMLLLVGVSGGLRELLRRLRRLEAAVHSTQEGIAVTDLELGEAGPRLRFANASFLRESGVRTGAPALARYAAQIDAAWRHDLQAALHGGQPFVRQLRMPASGDRAERVVELSIDLVRDRAGRPTELVLVQRDVTAYKRLEQRLAHQAQHDSLTGLPNRLAFETRLHSQIRDSPDAPFAVLLLDLDGFKTVNDTLGHDAGDALLVDVSQRLKAAVRSGDLVARLGGDEFVVITSPLSQDADARPLAERLLAAFREPFEVRARFLALHASVGVSLWPAHGPDSSSLFKHADVAMYAAKQRGRNGVYVFTPAPPEEALG
ncbi:sensor domain-containing diguanylate cyclase [Deinococcus koreensis]|uniref:GGDEF domain-containing protein n=1 Tax=Deinococcus koreensis TaxID=2054903 RepID=A0A2K3USC7_9DEIO|nr:sensor domain-containing diguanylate cyclase [Deinococcus koreensis]PNY79428.1 hypothetical protein CVO96_18480 [Deinococcus koreensis]